MEQTLKILLEELREVPSHHKWRYHVLAHGNERNKHRTIHRKNIGDTHTDDGLKSRGELFEELIVITGWERKHANKVLLGLRRSRR